MTNSRLTTFSSRLLSALLMNKQILATVSFTLFRMYNEATKGYKFVIIMNILMTCIWVCLCLPSDLTALNTSIFWYFSVLLLYSTDVGGMNTFKRKCTLAVFLVGC